MDEVRLVERGGMAVALVPIVRQVGDDGVPTTDGDLKNRWSPRTIAVPEPWSLRLAELCEDRQAKARVAHRLREPMRRKLADELEEAEKRAGLTRSRGRSGAHGARGWPPETGAQRSLRR